MLQSGAQGSPAWFFLPCYSSASFPPTQPLLKVGLYRAWFSFWLSEGITSVYMQVVFACISSLLIHPWVIQNSFSNYKGLGACGIHVSRGDGGVSVFRCTGPAVCARRLGILTLLSQDMLWGHQLERDYSHTQKLNTQKGFGGAEPGSGQGSPGFSFWAVDSATTKVSNKHPINFIGSLLCNKSWKPGCLYKPWEQGFTQVSWQRSRVWNLETAHFSSGSVWSKEMCL